MKDPLKLIEQYFDWDYQILTCDKQEEISKLEIEKAKDAFNFLKNHLGNDFPKEILKAQTRFNSFFWNIVPWTRVWFTWLAESIKYLKNSGNFENVLKKLKSNTKEDFEEALTLLEYGLKFKKAGFKVDFEVEILNSSKKIKNPDIQLTNSETNEIIYVEVTRLTPNVNIEEWANISQRASQYGFMHGKQINFAGRLFKAVSKERLKEIYSEVDKMANEIVQNGSFEEYKIKGVIEIALADKKHIPILAQWSKEHGHNIDTFSLPYLDKFKRLRSKIGKKSQQSSPSNPNLLIIKNEDYSSEPDADKIFYELEESLFKCEDLLGSIIVSYQFGSRDKIVESIGMNTLITKTERHALSSSTAIMINKFYKKTKITMHSLTRIVDAFDNN